MTHDTQELVAELRADAKLHNDLLPDRAADALTAQAEEIRALREGLQAIETLSAHQNNGILYTDDAMGWNMALDDAVDITRAALAGKGEA